MDSSLGPRLYLSTHPACFTHRERKHIYLLHETIEKEQMENELSNNQLPQFSLKAFANNFVMPVSSCLNHHLRMFSIRNFFIFYLNSNSIVWHVTFWAPSQYLRKVSTSVCSCASCASCACR